LFYQFPKLFCKSWRSKGAFKSKVDCAFAETGLSIASVKVSDKPKFRFCQFPETVPVNVKQLACFAPKVDAVLKR
jgi:hypothetical protein